LSLSFWDCFSSVPHPFIRRAERGGLKGSGDNGTVGAVNALIPVKLHLLKMHPAVY